MRNKYYSHTQDYLNRWIVSYADFVTMLLALFMVMYALSQMDINNMKEFSSSVGQAFDVSEVRHGVKDIKKIDILKYKRELLRIFSTTQVQIKSNPVDISGQNKQISTLKTQIKNIETQVGKDAIEFNNIETLINKNLGEINGLSITRESRGLIIRLKDTVLFDPGSDIIKHKTRTTLDQLAGILKEIPNSIKIEGHSDNQPIMTSRFPSNWELSTARATNIIRYLVNNHNFNPSKLSAVGYGEYMPLQTNSTPEGRAINRRVDIVILSSTSKIFEPSAANPNKLRQ